MCVSETAIRIRRCADGKHSDHANVYYRLTGRTPSQLLSCTNLTKHIPRLRANKIVYALEKNNHEGAVIFRWEQKNKNVPMDQISKYIKPRNIVLDMFADSFSKLRVWLFIDKPLRFVHWDVHETCLQTRMSSILEMFSKQIMNPRLYTNEQCDLEKMATIYLTHKKEAHMQRRRTLWTSPTSCSPVQYLSEHIVSYLCSSQKGYRLYEGKHRIEMNIWASLWYKRIHETKSDHIISAECVTYHLQIRQSSIEGAGVSVLTVKAFAKEDNIISYYGTLIYRYLSRRAPIALDKAYGDGCMAASPNDFMKCATVIGFQTERDRNGGRFNVWIYPEHLYVALCINDPQNIGPNVPTKKERQANPNEYRLVDVYFD